MGGVFLGRRQPTLYCVDVSKSSTQLALDCGRPAFLDRALVIADGDPPPPPTRKYGIASAELCVDKGSDLAIAGRCHEPWDS